MYIYLTLIIVKSIQETEFERWWDLPNVDASSGREARREVRHPIWYVAESKLREIGALDDSS